MLSECEGWVPGGARLCSAAPRTTPFQCTAAYVSIRQHPSAYVSILQHMCTDARILEHTSAGEDTD
jgi:hypothetical protein